MSLTKFEFIEPQDFIDLKNQVKNEVKRRNYADLDKLYNKYGIDAYDFNIVPEQDLSITYEDIRTILTPLEAINKSTLGVDLSQNGIISIEDFQKIQNALSVFSKGQRRENNTCSANCIGMCVSTCYDACTGCTSCSGTCAGSCYGCTGGCGGACGGCTGTCSGGCYPSCHTNDGGFTGGGFPRGG